HTAPPQIYTLSLHDALPISLLEKYVRTGQVKFVVDDFPLASLHPTAPRGATATLCVAEQGAIRFWQMHDALFQAQQQWSRKGLRSEEHTSELQSRSDLVCRL